MCNGYHFKLINYIDGISCAANSKEEVEKIIKIIKNMMSIQVYN